MFDLVGGFSTLLALGFTRSKVLQGKVELAEAPRSLADARSPNFETFDDKYHDTN